ncbi:MAG: lipoyl(octanoyl) transferase LipB [Candidatus Marinimicrobia bacterium]|nr:lipoyl(octanoyl) transferase LipB [Candidatus Neomarinimicrobiota bacterium]
MLAEVIVAANRIRVLDLGSRSYQETWDLQKRLQAQRIAGKIDDTLILVEHEPVYTIGKNADRSNLMENHPADIKVYQVERGGDITYHGPGQLVGYPILDLHGYQKSVGWYMRSLEEVLIKTLAEFGISAERRPRFTGVWIGEEKIAALGVRLSRWVSMHGFALNVNTDLGYYAGIVPCGISQFGITTMRKILKREINIDEVRPVIINNFSKVFDVEMELQ